MPLGGSVTRGVGSSHGAGYRKSLLRMLEQRGVNARMVGSRRDGSMSNGEHEGWRGFRIDEIERKARRSVEGLSPDIVMVNAGSNDCLQAFGVTEVGERMSQLLEFLWGARPQSTVLLSTLIACADREVDSTVQCVNAQFRALAEKKATEHKRIVLVDMYSSEGPDVRGLVDGIHPNDDGYDKMAMLWVRGIQEAVDREFINLSTYKFEGESPR